MLFTTDLVKFTNVALDSLLDEVLTEAEAMERYDHTDSVDYQEALLTIWSIMDEFRARKVDVPGVPAHISNKEYLAI
jgi:hypothetical protein